MTKLKEQGFDAAYCLDGSISVNYINSLFYFLYTNEGVTKKMKLKVISTKTKSSLSFTVAEDYLNN